MKFVNFILALTISIHCDSLLCIHCEPSLVHVCICVCASYTCHTGTADSRYIRAETCLFMVKLPQYSSVEIMNEKLRYAINCREDPLSG